MHRICTERIFNILYLHSYAMNTRGALCLWIRKIFFSPSVIIFIILIIAPHHAEIKKASATLIFTQYKIRLFRVCLHLCILVPTYEPTHTFWLSGLPTVAREGLSLIFITQNKFPACFFTVIWNNLYKHIIQTYNLSYRV